MARPFRWLTALVLFMSLAACGGQAAAPSPTTAPTPVPVAVATAAPTTAAPTEAATEAPTEVATAAPTEAATEAPTEVVTEAPTEAVTAAATTAATEATSGAPGGELAVFAAASLTDAFNELGKTFEAAHAGTTVTFNFAGSQQLAQQIGQGASVDVFAAASKKTMETVITSGQVISGTARTFVRNRLVVIYPKDNPARLKELKDLAKPGLKLDLAAKEVPVGQYALDFLDKATADPTFGATFKDDVLKNVVSYEENVKAVLSKVTLGEADAGIVYTTDITLAAGDKVGRIDIPDPLNTIAAYPIAALKDAPHADLAKEFVTFILSPEAQQVLVKYGFIPTTGSASGAAPGAMPLVIGGLVTTPITLTADDLKKMEQVSVKATDKGGTEQTYTGVAIATLLKNAGVKAEATKVIFMGGDGYTQTLSLPDLLADTNAIITVDANGSLRNILPSQMPKFWVKGLVKLDVQ